MATGIVSRAMAQTGARSVSTALFGAATALYVVLLAATAVKAAYHRRVLGIELGDPARLFGHFTLVAAGGVLVTGLGHGPATLAACALFTVSATVWAALAPAVVRLLLAGHGTALRQADGTWFLACVGLQSLVLCLVHLRPDRPTLAAATLLWCAAVLLYAATLAAVVRRLRLAPPRPAQLAAGYWVTMGAAAISTLGGARLLVHHELLLPAARTLLGALVTALWVWATALIPLLLAAGVWRHLRHHVPLHYDPALWCIVFPLGMYATATAQLAATRPADSLPFPQRPLAWTALAVWLAVTAHCLRSRFRRGREDTGDASGVG